MGSNPALQALNSLGQSVWYDNLSRSVLEDGTLKNLVSNGVRGLTSNPTIFKKAIADTDEYDDLTIENISTNPGASTDEITEVLMIRDVAAAADLLLPVYNESNGSDGYASIEVSPRLAHDTATTLAAARYLWQELDSPNVMIKVPATVEGLSAIETLLYEGINVNITLIFSCDRYKSVAEAYCRALARRAAEGKPVDKIASVASFFVSRVDSICEKEFAARGLDFTPFLGKVGIANSKRAYHLFQQIFDGELFRPAKDAGAMVQRPLWASTGTKNPDFDPLLYVKELAGPDTVNTLPPQTLDALMKHSGEFSNSISKGYEEAEALLAELNQIVSLEKLLRTLEKEGVTAFADSYKELLDSVARKASNLRN